MNELFVVRKAVEALHRRPEMAVVYATGAGAGLQYMLWETPGSSRTILEAAFPYHPQALEDILGRQPERSCCRDTAILMAGAAYARAMEIAQRTGIEKPLLGLGLTGAVSTDRERRGDDRVFAAVKTADNVFTEEFVFDKVVMTRQSEGFFCDAVGLNLLLFAANLEQVSVLGAPRLSPVPVLKDVESIAVRPLFRENGMRGDAKDLDPAKNVLYPGSYNPLHYGHLKAARAVEKMSGKRVVYHVTADHPAKGTLSVEEIDRRLRQFSGIGPVLLTKGDSLYVQKARQFPGFGFIVGADAVLGLCDLKYYGGDRQAMYAALTELIELGTRFYVVGRMVNGHYMEATEAPIPPEFRHLCIPVPGRWDVASSQLRAKSA